MGQYSIQSQGALLDVLSRIFLYSVPTYTRVTQIPPPSLCQAPLTISHVCRTWRHIALTTPSLWSSIQFEVDTNRRTGRETEIKERTQKLEKSLVWLEMYMSRSRNSELDLYVDIPEINGSDFSLFDDETVQRVRGALNMLFEQRSRWRAVRLRVHFSILQQPQAFQQRGLSVHPKRVLDNLNSAHFLSLEIIGCSVQAVQVFLDLSASSGLREVEFLANAPRLGPLQWGSGDGCGPPLSKLTRIKLVSDYQFSFQSFIDFLIHTPLIEEIAVCVPYIRGIGQTAKQHLVLCNLHILNILPMLPTNPTDTDLTNEFLSCITAPTLERLHVAFPFTSSKSEAMGQEILHLLERSSEHHRPLSGIESRQGIKHFSSSGDHSGDWLINALPYLQYAEFIKIFVGGPGGSEILLNAFLKELLSDNNTPNLPCPRLKELWICGVALVEDTLATLFDIRTKPSTSCDMLEKVVLFPRQFIRSGGIRVPGLGNGMSEFMARPDVKRAIGRGLLVSQFDHRRVGT